MIIATWNCNMAFRKKITHILEIKPDILVVPECEHPDRLFIKGSFRPHYQLWFGENNNKGLGIFSFSNYSLELHKNYNPNYRYIIPISVTGEKNFTLFAVWAMNDLKNPKQRYIGQVWNALNYYFSEMENNIILIGDFNSNSIWDNDKPLKVGNHSDVVRLLLEKHIISAYHHYHVEEHGYERHPTFYMYRKIDRPYHIDYCFLSENFINSLTKVTVGTYSEWMKYSDHVPLIVEIETQ